MSGRERREVTSPSDSDATGGQLEGEFDDYGVDGEDTWDGEQDQRSLGSPRQKADRSSLSNLRLDSPMQLPEEEALAGLNTDNLAALRHQLKLKIAQLSGMERERADLRERLEETQVEIQSSVSTIRQLESTQRQLLDQYSKYASDLEKEVQQLTSNLAAAQKSNRELRALVSKKTRAEKRLGNKLSGAQLKAGKNASKASATRKEKKSMGAKMDKLKVKNRKLGAENRTLKKQISKLKLMSTKSKLAQIQAQVAEGRPKGKKGDPVSTRVVGELKKANEMLLSRNEELTGQLQSYIDGEHTIALQAEVDELKAKLEASKAKLNEERKKRAGIEALRDSVATVQAKYNKVEQTIKQLRTSLEEEKLRSKTAKQKAVALKHKLEKTKELWGRDKAGLEAKAHQLLKMEQALREEQSRKHTDTKALEAAYGERDALEAENEELLGQVEELGQQIQQLKEGGGSALRVKKLSGKLKKLDASVKTAEKNAKQAVKEAKRHRNRAIKAEKALKTAQNELDRVQEDWQKAMERMKAAEKSSNSSGKLKQQLAASKEANAQTERKLHMCLNELKDSQSRMNANTKTLKRAQERMEDLQDKLKAVKEHNKRLEDHCAQMASSMESLIQVQEENEALKETCARLRQDAGASNSLADQLGQLQTEVSELQATRQTLSKQLKERGAAVATLKKKFNRKLKDSKELAAKVKKLQDTVKALRRGGDDPERNRSPSPRKPRSSKIPSNVVLPVGCDVVINNLVRGQELNGQQGAVAEYLPGKQRYRVKLKGGRTVNVKPGNLQVTETRTLLTHISELTNELNHFKHHISEQQDRGDQDASSMSRLQAANRKLQKQLEKYQRATKALRDAVGTDPKRLLETLPRLFDMDGVPLTPKRGATPKKKGATPKRGKRGKSASASSTPRRDSGSRSPSGLFGNGDTIVLPESEEYDPTVLQSQSQILKGVESRMHAVITQNNRLEKALARERLKTETALEERAGATADLAEQRTKCDKMRAKKEQLQSVNRQLSEQLGELTSALVSSNASAGQQKAMEQLRSEAVRWKAHAEALERARGGSGDDKAQARMKKLEARNKQLQNRVQGLEDLINSQKTTRVSQDDVEGYWTNTKNQYIYVKDHICTFESGKVYTVDACGTGKVVMNGWTSSIRKLEDELVWMKDSKTLHWRRTTRRGSAGVGLDYDSDEHDPDD